MYANVHDRDTALITALKDANATADLLTGSAALALEVGDTQAAGVALALTYILGGKLPNALIMAAGDDSLAALVIQSELFDVPRQDIRQVLLDAEPAVLRALAEREYA